MPQQVFYYFPEATFIGQPGASRNAPGSFTVPAGGPDDMTPPHVTLTNRVPPLLPPPPPPPPPPADNDWVMVRACSLNSTAPPPPPPPPIPQVSIYLARAATPHRVPTWVFNPPPAIYDERAATVFNDKKPEWRILPSGNDGSAGANIVWKFN